MYILSKIFPVRKYTQEELENSLKIENPRNFMHFCSLQMQFCIFYYKIIYKYTTLNPYNYAYFFRIFTIEFEDAGGGGSRNGGWLKDASITVLWASMSR